MAYFSSVILSRSTVLIDGDVGGRIDECADSNTLTEFYCADESTAGLDSHTCEFGCDSGRCLPEQPACTDSDADEIYFPDGLNYDEKGYIITHHNGIRSDDVCRPSLDEDENDLLEYYCTDNPLAPALGIIYSCPFDCGDGRCLEETEIFIPVAASTSLY